VASERDYEGTELELFEGATNWKRYWASRIAPYVRGAALEVGAGRGANVANFGHLPGVHWTLLEPDRALSDTIRQKIAAGQLPADTEVSCGMLGDLPTGRLFDSILYIDVLEHIENDGEELRRAAEKLKPGGNIVVLSPAYQQVYSPFDAAIGHYRRYDRRSLLAATPSTLKPVRTFYLDSLGLILSIINRYLARQSSPTPATIKVWDSMIVPLSRIADPLVGHSVGRSIVGVWSKA
jgi:hypothetical protein